MSAEAPKHSAIKSVISGGVGGMCLVAVGHPFDLVKVRLQTSTIYSGMADCVKKTIAQDGIKGLFRGMSAPLAGVTPIYAVCFWGYDVGKNLSRTFQKDKEAPLTIRQIMFAGAFSALPTTLIMAPGERIKVLLQVDGASTTRKFRGPVDVIAHLYRTGGIKSIFKGFNATLIRDVPGSIAYFGGFEFFKRALTPAGSDPTQLNPLSSFIAGGLAGICNWIVAIPPDVVKSRFQSAPEGTYKGFMDVCKVLFKEEGVRGFFKGLTPAMARAFPANAACFLGVDMTMNLLNKAF
eukprot:TRINITY_DN9722_c0_g1_i1.p1 TRINITY_DN9722_c0_g1~~TRINITY_DN9722_c0_g1_i1.p1  ORF type:complete len:300 (+),score=126.03 TRINITY_DN9722_c0_g1_i1:22-900(+)